MTKYKLDKQVQERLDIVNELNIKIEEMSPNEARQIPWTCLLYTSPSPRDRG